MPDRSTTQLYTVFRQKAQGNSGLFAPKQLITLFGEIVTDLLFPPRCAGCGRIDTYWCSNCAHDVEIIPYPSNLPPAEPIAGVAATGLHEDKLREAVQALKYENARAVAVPLGKRLAECLVRQQWMIDTIIPVPLHTMRLKERGYNQAQLLAEQVAQMTGIRCQPQALERIRNTQSQVTLSGTERASNLQDAFAANPVTLQNHVILLIDDVYTTGSTLRACSTALIEAGAQKVYGLTVTAARI